MRSEKKEVRSESRVNIRDLRKLFTDSELELGTATEGNNKDSTWLVMKEEQPLYVLKEVAAEDAERVYERLKHIYDQTNAIPEPLCVFRQGHDFACVVNRWFDGGQLSERANEVYAAKQFSKAFHDLHHCSLLEIDKSENPASRFHRAICQYDQINIADSFRKPYQLTILQRIVELKDYYLPDLCYTHIDLHMGNIIVDRGIFVSLTHARSDRTTHIEIMHTLYRFIHPRRTAFGERFFKPVTSIMMCGHS